MISKLELTSSFVGPDIFLVREMFEQSFACLLALISVYKAVSSQGESSSVTQPDSCTSSLAFRESVMDCYFLIYGCISPRHATALEDSVWRMELTSLTVT